MKNKHQKIIEIGLIGFSLYYFIMFLYVSISRMGYPFQLEWMDGGTLQEIQRILNGEPLYVKPSIEYIPYIYGPVYFYVTALFAKIFGLNYLIMRLISFVSTLLSFCFIYIIVVKETKEKWAGVLSVGLFSSMYVLSATWFDMGRVDMLSILLVLMGIYLLHYCQGKKNWIVSGLFLSLSIFTKQSFLLVVIVLGIYYIFRDRKRLFWSVSSFSIISLIVIVFFQYYSKGWFLYYLFILPKEHPLIPKAITYFWTNDMNKLILLIATIVFCFVWRYKKKERRGFQFLFFFSFMLIGYFSRIHSGGYLNVILPSYLVISIFGSVSYCYFLKNKFKYTWVITCVLYLQFIFLIYNPHPFIPTKEDKTKGYEIVHMIQDQNGEVLDLSNGYLNVMAGKDEQAHFMALYDVLRGKDTQIKRALVGELNFQLKNHTYQMLIFDEYDIGILKKNGVKIDDDYSFKGKVQYTSNEFYPKIGQVKRPTYIYKIK